MRSIIVAYDMEGGIGKDGRLLWEPHELRDDLANFSRITTGASTTDDEVGNTVIMGRKTYESLPSEVRPLPRRQNIILTRHAMHDMVHPISADTAPVLHASSIGDAYSQADGQDVWVIGGAEVYRQALPTVNRVIATRVLRAGGDADTIFPALPEDEWELFHEREIKKSDRNRFGMIMSTYIRYLPVSEG